MESKIDLLRQENTRLIVKITGLESEKVELLKQVAEERAKHEAENAELRSRIEELEKGRTDTIADNVRRDDEIAELKVEVVKLAEGAQARDVMRRTNGKLLRLLMYLAPL